MVVCMRISVRKGKHAVSSEVAWGVWMPSRELVWWALAGRWKVVSALRWNAMRVAL
jgi:hypothetical protein